MLLFTDRIRIATRECRVLRAEATIAAYYHLTTGLERRKGAILFNPSGTGVHVGAPRPLIDAFRTRGRMGPPMPDRGKDQ